MRLKKVCDISTKFGWKRGYNTQTTRPAVAENVRGSRQVPLMALGQAEGEESSGFKELVP